MKVAKFSGTFVQIGGLTFMSFDGPVTAASTEFLIHDKDGDVVEAEDVVNSIIAQAAGQLAGPEADNVVDG